MTKKSAYLTVHGHFYQPPRENPWIEAIELQDSALPFHDWNERINNECYNPNSVSKIVDNHNRILDIVNNYSSISFNFGPTLLSWLEEHSPLTYERIIKADIESAQKFAGHGNALAQVYNHMIMPLANLRDKITQTIWGIKDFEYRFGRKPEGIWLAETAVDDETLSVLVDYGIKFTILSPYQGDKIRKIGDKNWTEVSWGNIDPARPYRYFIKSNPEKYIDLFFYDGAISKSVAFDELLKDGEKFTNRLKDGVSHLRDYDEQIVNIATDGESYGHHTKFGDMALAYVLRIKAEDEGFIITNYAQYLAEHTVGYEVEIKQASSWSCFHGVERWQSDCGCSTGGGPGWNQKWRKPLRNALDYLRDELSDLFEKKGADYFKNPWEARNKYIDVILDRNELTIRAYLDEVLDCNIDECKIVGAMKLLEMQRQAMLMYTSCGWFFSEISGIETTQIMKYAARAMQLASEFCDEDFEGKFLEILDLAKSNIPELGTGRDIYEKFVRPSIVTTKQMVSLWAISSLYEDFEDKTSLYCYDIKKIAYKKNDKGATHFVMGAIEIKSKITLEKSNMTFALLQFTGGDFHCAIKQSDEMADFNTLQKELTKIYQNETPAQIIRAIDKTFGEEYYTLKNIFIEERRKILNVLLEDKISKFSSAYQEMYEEGKSSIYHLQNLGLDVPTEFKLAAGYTLSQEFNKLIEECSEHFESELIQHAIAINKEAKKINVKLDKRIADKIFSDAVKQSVFRLSKNLESHRLDRILQLFGYVDKLNLKINISETQNIYFTKIFHQLGDLIENIEDSSDISADKEFIEEILKLGTKLNITTDFYKALLDRKMLSLQKKS